MAHVIGEYPSSAELPPKANNQADVYFGDLAGRNVDDGLCAAAMSIPRLYAVIAGRHVNVKVAVGV